MNRRIAIFLLFFASGFSGLVYEVVWMRQLSVVFGSTVYATSTVLAGFMGGLAVGSFCFGKIADRKSRLLEVYGLMEILIGLLALVFPFVLRGLTPLYVWSARVSGLSHHHLSLLHALLIVCVLLIPTALMGGTLPILVKYMSKEFSSLGRSLSLLYGLNTLGAVIGCATAGLVLIGGIGVKATTAVAVIVSVAVGVVAIILGRTDSSLPAEPADLAVSSASAGETVYPPWLQSTVLVLFALCGFAAMAYEVLWTRVLVFLTGGTSYAFTVMLTTYLCGLALGSVLITRVVDRSKRLLELFSVLQILIGLGILATLTVTPAVLRTLSSLLFRETSLRHGDLMSFLLLEAMVSLVFIFPFTLLMGMSFPVVGKIYATTREHAGARIGIAYFADTIGCILGSLAAGFLLIPAFGTLGSLRGMSVLSLFTGAVALSCVGRERSDRPGFSPLRLAGLTALTILVAVVARRNISDTTFADVFTAPGSRLIYLNEDIGGTVTIEQYEGYKTISINGVNVAGTDLKFETTQKLQAHLALLLHPQPRKVMQIGFGSGGTAWAITRHPVEQIDCVEITAAILKARDEMKEVNHGVLSVPRVNVFVDDARSYMLKCAGGYDAILSDSIHPRRAGNGGLYSVDYFRLCREKLASNGIFSAWLPIYGLSLDDFRVTVRSLKEVFPHVYVFHTPVGRNEWSIILGMNNPLKIDLEMMRQKLRSPAIANDLKLIFVEREADIVSAFLLGDANTDLFLGSSRTLNTDDYPYLEYIAAKSGIVNSREGLLLPLYTELVKCREDVSPYVFPPSAAADAALRNSLAAMTRLLNGRLLEFGSKADAEKAVAEFQEALKLDPGNGIIMDLLSSRPVY